jgi:hypothetical protein
MRSRMIFLPLGVLLAASIAILIALGQPLATAQESVPAAAQQPAARGEGPRSTRSSSVSGIEGLPAEDRSFDKQQLKRLRVSWEKPKRTVDKDDWHTPLLEVSGKLSLLQADGKTLEPVDWPYPIQVVIAQRPNQKPDWSRWHDRDYVSFNTMVGWHFIHDSLGGSPLPKKPAGVFTAYLRLADIETAIGATKPFQIGLSFGEKKGKTVTWTNVVPILAQSITMLDVPGPKPLSRTLELINACPTPPFGGRYDPITLVRAANHLQSLGKDKAIAAMREYAELAPVTGIRWMRSHPANPKNIDSSDQQCLGYLIPLVFDNLSNYEWIKVWQGIPFHTAVIGGSSGQIFSTRPLVESAAESGKLRKMPLRPADNPLEAADSLFKKIIASTNQNKQERNDGVRELLRRQAWGAIRHLIDPDGKQHPNLTSPATWDKLKARATRLKIRWDESRQVYVAGEKSK